MKIAFIKDGIVTQLKVGEVDKFDGWTDVTVKYVGVGFTDNGDGTFTDGRASISLLPIRKITTQAFFRRLSFPERKTLRNSTKDTVIDLREDLQRSPTVDLDGTIERQLLDTALLSPDRIAVLLADGTTEEM